MSESAASYCADQVKRGDPDRYHGALFAPRVVRQRLLALYAFNLEVARIPEIVSEPLLGEIRLQWWRDSIDQIYAGSVGQHEVVTALALAIHSADLPKNLFEQLFQARESDLEEVPFETWPDLVAYMTATSSGLMALAAMILTPGANSEEINAACLPAGQAWAVTGLLRALPYHARRNQIYLPLDLLDTYRVCQADLLAGRMTPELGRLIGYLAQLARAELALARPLIRQLGSHTATLPAFLPLALCEPYLRRLEQPHFDPFIHGPGTTLLSRQLRLLWQGLMGRL